jgi:hypothetical protein
MTTLTTTTWTREDLQHELLRRAAFPAHSDQIGITKPQEVTAEHLSNELAVTPDGHPDQEWRIWELALAEEHERMNPGVPFVRSVPVDVVR